MFGLVQSVVRLFFMYLRVLRIPYAVSLVRMSKYLTIMFSLAPALLNLLVSYFVCLDIPRLHQSTSERQPCNNPRKLSLKLG